MVIVDERGFINFWEYFSECLLGFGWFVFSVKYRVKLLEIIYRFVVGV